MGISIGKILTGVGKTVVNVGAKSLTGQTVFKDPFGGGVTSSATPSDWSAAAEQQAYENAWYGDRPDLFAKLQSWAAKGVQSAKNAVTDLQARGWYGGTRSGAYLNDNTSGSVNHGQGPRQNATVAQVVNAAVTAAGNAVAQQIAPDVVERPLGVAAAPTNTGSSPFTSPIFLVGGLLVVVALFFAMRK